MLAIKTNLSIFNKKNSKINLSKMGKFEGVFNGCRKNPEDLK